MPSSSNLKPHNLDVKLETRVLQFTRSISKMGKKKSASKTSEDSVVKNITMSQQLSGSGGRYFTTKTDKTIEDEVAAVESDDSNDDVEAIPVLDIDKNQNGETDDDSDSGNENNSSDDNDNESEGEEECTGSGESEEEVNDRNVISLKKPKTFSKQQSKATSAKGTKATPVSNLPKFQGTGNSDTSETQLEVAKSSKRKRKKQNKDEEGEETVPAKKASILDDNTESLLDKRREERDARSLFLKNLPPNVTAEAVKKLSPEIINVRIPLEHGKKLQSLYAFIEFENEETAKRNYKKLLEKQIDNKKVVVDFCGEKSKFRRTSKLELPVNERKLFISNVPTEVTIEELKKFMPEATNFSSKLRGTKRLVFITFDNKENARKAFEESGKLIVQGKKLTVLFAYKKSPRVSKFNKRKPHVVQTLFEDEDDTETGKMNSCEKSKETLAGSAASKTEKKKRSKKKKNKNNVISST